MEPLQRAQKIAKEYCEGWMPKAGGIAQFCSWHALLFAGLLEGDRNVATYQTRPVVIGHYAADFQYVCKDDEKVVVAIASASALPVLKKRIGVQLTSWCKANGATASFVSHEEIDRESRLAFEWIRISRVIAQCKHLDMKAINATIKVTLSGAEAITLRNLIAHHALLSAEQCAAAVGMLMQEGAAEADLHREEFSLRLIVRERG